MVIGEKYPHNIGIYISSRREGHTTNLMVNQEKPNYTAIITNLFEFQFSHSGVFDRKDIMAICVLWARTHRMGSGINGGNNGF
jgi:hypothetical protein